MMSPRQIIRNSPWLSCLPALLAAGCGGLGRPATGPKIYVCTDLEGASGVYAFAQTRERDTPAAVQAREYFMGDLAAVVRGLRDSGASEIVVLDGHGNGAILPHLMPPGARCITGRPRPGPLAEMDSSFDGCVMLAYHAMMGTPDAVLCHTQSSRTENRYWYNGVESGELVQDGAIAGHYGVPPILVTGDEATCREARRFYGPECITVAVKKGLSREAAVLYPFSETRKALYEGARLAVTAIPRCKPYRLSLPIQAKKQWLIFDKPDSPGRLETKEGTITDILQLLEF